MKVTELKKETQSYWTLLEVENEGKTYRAFLSWSSEYGYDVEWKDSEGNRISEPEFLQELADEENVEVGYLLEILEEQTSNEEASA